MKYLFSLGIKLQHKILKRALSNPLVLSARTVQLVEFSEIDDVNKEMYVQVLSEMPNQLIN